MKKAIIKTKFCEFEKRIKILNPVCPKCGGKWFYIIFPAAVIWDIYENIDTVTVLEQDYENSVVFCNSCDEQWHLKYQTT